MIKIHNYASLEFDLAAYLSFNNKFEITDSFGGSRKRLVLFFKPGNYVVSGTLKIRKVLKTPPFMDYIYCHNGQYSFKKSDKEFYLLLK